MNGMNFANFGESIIGNVVELNLTNGPEDHDYHYVLRGSNNVLAFRTYDGINGFLRGISRSYDCFDGICPSNREIYLRFLDESNSKSELDKLVQFIKSQSATRDDQARIAINLVQNIPYDFQAAANSDPTSSKYPYQVLYENKGVCQEKSELLVYLLRGLGYGTALLEFGPENHMAVGIRCSARYTYKDTGYCFIESTAPKMMTNSDGDYLSKYGTQMKLYSDPIIYKISDGDSFESADEEYNDAIEYQSLVNLGSRDGSLDRSNYDIWIGLNQKYGIPISSE